jgi:hypothetical protein
MHARVLRAAALTCGAALASASVANAELIYGITGAVSGVNLVSFDSATPGTVTTIGALSGANTGHSIRGIDFRPANGQLYAISTDTSGSNAQVYIVNLATGALTAQGPAFTLGTNTSLRVSMDFNPAADRLRIVTGGGTSNNFRWNPVTNAFVQQDGDLRYDAGDVNAAANPPFVVGVAYDRNDNDPLTGTTMYTWDFNLDVLSTTGNVNGTPNSPNTGLMFTVGGPATFLTNDGGVGFDVSVSGTAYFSYNDFSTLQERFATLDLATGLPTLVGAFPSGLDVLDISAVVPEPTTLGLIGVAAIGLLRRRRA